MKKNQFILFVLFIGVTFNSIAQNKAIAMTIENQVFLPMKEVLKLNILQFQQETVLFNREMFS